MLFWIIILFNVDTFINMIDNYFAIDNIFENHGTDKIEGYFKQEI